MFEAADAKLAPPPAAVLFVGTSSIRKWTTLAGFPRHEGDQPRLRRVVFSDSPRYAQRIVTPYPAAAILVYAGDNDVAAGHTPEQVLADFKAFVSRVRGKLPKTPICSCRSSRALGEATGNAG